MRILLAIDNSRHSEAAIATVVTQFRPNNIEVRVFHAVEWLREMPPWFFFAEGPTAGSEVLEQRNESFERATQLVERASAQLKAAGFRTTTDMPDVDPRRGIVEAAAQWKADLIVMGSHGRTGLGRLLLGSVAEAVLNHAACSVQIVRVPPEAASHAA